MPNPSQVRAQDVNTELGVPTTTSIKMSNNWVLNVASVSETVTTNTYDSGSGSVTAPANATRATIYVWGGGGAGNNSGYAGGGGGFTLKNITVTGGSTTISYNVGAAGIASGGNGGTSNATVSGTVYNATGGGGGTASLGGSAGVGSGGDVNENGTGGSSYVGGAAGGITYGGGGGGVNAAGSAPGGGGGNAAFPTNTGFNGAAGRVKIEWFTPNAPKFSRLRWGINFPGRAHGNYLSSINYGATPNVDINSTYLGYYPNDSEAIGESYLIFYTNGVLRMVATAGGNSAPAANQNFHRTWLTSGANSDYTVQLNVTGGALNASSAAANTDFALTADRYFYVSTGITGAGQNSEEAFGNLIIKSGGTEIFRRPFVLSTSVDLQVL